MNEVKANQYGMTHAGGVSDMLGAALVEELEKHGISYERVDMEMGTFLADPAYIVSYNRPSNSQPVSIFVIPQAGADSWAEEYLYFVGTAMNEMLEKDWPSIIDNLRHLAFPRFYGQK